jgi:hypothetical protein
MTEVTAVTVPDPDSQMAKAMEAVMMAGDLSKLNAEQRVTYVRRICESLGLNWMTQPFKYITLNNKLTLYATRDAAEQLRKVNGISIEIIERTVLNGVYVVRARGTEIKTGRVDESTGAVALGASTGEDLANKYMKAETKAKRRVTLSICGLGFLDELEVESVKQTESQPPRFAAPSAYLPPPPAASFANLPSVGEPEPDKATFTEAQALPLPLD